MEYNVYSPRKEQFLHRDLVQFSSDGNIEKVKELVAMGADPKQNNSYALLRAANYGHSEVVKYLIEHGADPHADDDFAFVWASENGNIELVEYLLNLGANIQTMDNAAFFWAAYNSNFDIMRLLLSKGINPKNNLNFALCQAAEYGELELVEKLILLGADDFNNPVIMAAENGHLPTLQYLVSRGGNVRGCDDEALRFASANNRLETIRYLVGLGAPAHLLTDRQNDYISFCARMEKNVRDRAQKKIYFWWIPICYDLSRDVGKRMAEKNLAVFRKLTSCN